MSAQCVNCEIELNNDIMGIGVRAALYSQIILAWGMSLKYPNTFVKNSRASYMIATALLVASLIQWKTQEFSLLDALVVSFMTSMMTVFIVVSGTFREEVKPTPQPSQTTDPNSAQANTPPDDPQSANTPPATQAMQPALSDPQQTATQAPDPPALRPRRSNTQWLILFCFVNLWGGFCFNLWKDPTHFGMKGGRANCTTNGDITIWVFGVEVQAVSPGIRIAALVLISILYLVALCSLFFTLEDVLDPAIRAFRLVGGFFTTESLKRGGATLPTTSPRSLHEDPAINKIHYLLHICAFGTLLYLLVSTEMTVRKNDDAGSTMEWSYGQVIALILLLQQIMDICSTIVEGREERELQKEQEEQERRRAQRLQAGTQHQDNIPMNNLPTTPNPAAST